MLHPEDVKNIRQLADDIRTQPRTEDRHPYLIGWLLGLASRIECQIRHSPRSDVEVLQDVIRP